MSARRKQLHGRKKNTTVYRKIIGYALVLVIFLLAFLYFTGTRKFWNGRDKVSIAIRSNSGDVHVVTFDPKTQEMLQITIPGNTEAEVARGLGIWKLTSVWELGEKESLQGLLLSRTLNKHFKFPVFLWADAQADGFFKGDIDSVITATLRPYKTNLGLGDRISIAIFSLRVKNTKRVELNLQDTTYLRKTTLTDGSEGYRVVGSIPGDIAVIFSDSTASKSTFRVGIKDMTGKFGIAEALGEVIEVFGGKVFSIEKGSEADSGCKVSAKVAQNAAKIALLFPCSVVDQPPDGNFDLEITIGKKFMEDY